MVKRGEMKDENEIVELESRINELEKLVVVQNEINSNTIKALKSATATLTTVLRLCEAMKIEMEVLRSEILPRN